MAGWAEVCRSFLCSIRSRCFSISRWPFSILCSSFSKWWTEFSLGMLLVGLGVFCSLASGANGMFCFCSGCVEDACCGLLSLAAGAISMRICPLERSALIQGVYAYYNYHIGLSTKTCYRVCFSSALETCTLKVQKVGVRSTAYAPT